MPKTSILKMKFLSITTRNMIPNILKIPNKFTNRFARFGFGYYLLPGQLLSSGNYYGFVNSYTGIYNPGSKKGNVVIISDKELLFKVEES